MAQDLFERIGGQDAIRATVIKLYEKILSDDLLSPFFADTDIDKLRHSQTAFVTMAFGGPNNYNGEGLRKAHRPLVEKGLSDQHFDAVASHLANAMRELGVEEALVQEALAIVGTTRNDVLCKNEAA